MQLKIILETVQDQVKSLSIKLSKPDNEIVKLVQSINRKYWKYILNQWYHNNIRLPEDAHRVKQALDSFQKHLSILPNKDINQYPKLSDIERVVSSAIGQKEETVLNKVQKYEGKVVNKYNEYVTIEIWEPESLKDIGEGTKWCTRKSYPDCMAQYYLDQYGSIFVILKDGRPFIQYTPDYDQIMDVNDEYVEQSDLEELNKIILPPDIKQFQKADKQSIKILQNYLTKVNNNRWPELESVIVDIPAYSVIYAIHAIGDKWPEAEEAISYSPIHAVDYALAFNRGLPTEQRRFIEAEPRIMRNPQAAVEYAEGILRGRWPEAEPYIAKDARQAFIYTERVLNPNLSSGYRNRFELAEPALAKSPAEGYKYAKLFGERWVAYEKELLKSLVEAIKKDQLANTVSSNKQQPPTWHTRYTKENIKDLARIAYMYIKNVRKTRWHNIEEYLKDTEYYLSYMKEFAPYEQVE